MSRASSIQRAGRAGRTAPGRCIRLFSKFDFDGRPMFEVPEIQRADLAQTVLELSRLGVEDVLAFPWFEHPGEAALRGSQRLLERLGAIDSRGALTSMGRTLVEWPVGPRIARLVYESARRGVSEAGIRCAAILGEGEIAELGSDWLTKIVSGRAEMGGSVRRMEERLEHALYRDRIETQDSGGSAERRLVRSLLAAYPDRVARKRPGQKPGSIELVLSSGGTASIDHTGEVSQAEYFLALDAEERKAAGQARGEIRVRSVCAIEPEWLFDLEPEQVSEREETLWDPERGRIETRYQMRYDALVLEESVQPPRDREASARVFARGLLEPRSAQHFQRICSSEVWTAFKNRLAFARGQQGLVDPSLLPDLASAEAIEALLADFIGERLSVGELEADGLIDHILACMDPTARAQFEKCAPEFVQLMGGRRCRIQYESDRPPWIESRLQDFFGMTQGPSIAAGRVSLILHLLAPNMRAVQVTQDLPGFWKRVYPDLRRELGRRYPRHKWPEDPLKPLPPSDRR